MRNIIIVPALAAFSLAIVSASASAETQTVPVHVADLDLTTPAGMATLEGRIAQAVERICGRTEVRQVRDGADYQRCVEEVTQSAQLEIARVTGKAPALALNGNGKPRG